MSLAERLQTRISWVAAEHNDHAPHRHIHIVAIVPEKLNVQDFQTLRQTATAACLAQRNERDLLREQSQEQEERGEHGSGNSGEQFRFYCFSCFFSCHLFHFDTRLHRARFARLTELKHLLLSAPRPDSLLTGKAKTICIVLSALRRLLRRRELGNLLLVAPTRAGKGLLATSQLLTWQHSVIVNDIKGELFNQTAGYRATLGEVFVIDPHGTGHRFDPLRGKQTEDELFSSSSRLLFHADEGDGAIFTQRATVMLTQLFLAARREDAPPLPYVRQIIRGGLAAAARAT